MVKNADKNPCKHCQKFDLLLVHDPAQRCYYDKRYKGYRTKRACKRMTKPYEGKGFGKFEFKDRSEFPPDLGRTKSESDSDSSASKVSNITEDDTSSGDESNEGSEEYNVWTKADWGNDSDA